jgi:hypothetical protein
MTLEDSVVDRHGPENPATISDIGEFYYNLPSHSNLKHRMTIMYILRKFLLE